MIEFIRGRGTRRGFYFCAIAALGFTLSGCGGSGASPAASAAPAQAAVSPQGTASAPSSSTGATGTAPVPSPASATSAPAGSPPPTASTGNVTLNWTPPTENVDGTALTNLAGYDIHYGTASGKYTQTVAVNNPGIATYVVSNLSPGTYYFSVTAVNSQGTESPMSAEVSTTVN
jgi:hypothetical protein